MLYPEPVEVHFRSSESYFVLSKPDRVTVIFSVAFTDPTDQAIARVFLQEFADSQRLVSSAPPCSFSADPPMELQSVSVVQADADLIGYLSFAIFTSHIEKVGMEHLASHLQNFRAYLNYHVKASKTYLHSRMRKRVSLLLQALKQAKPEDKSAGKKTISGKTFKRN